MIRDIASCFWFASTNQEGTNYFKINFYLLVIIIVSSLIDTFYILLMSCL